MDDGYFTGGHTYITMSGHIEYYGGGSSGGLGPGSGSLPAGSAGMMSGMDDSMQCQAQQCRPMSVCSVSSCGDGPSPIHRSGSGHYSSCGDSSKAQDELTNDEILVSLTVRELNKRLHGCPREEVSEVSQLCHTLVVFFCSSQQCN